MWLNSRNRNVIAVFVVLVTTLLAHARAAQAQNTREVAHIFIKMDFWEPVGSQSAEAWHEDPNNNGAWTQLSDWPAQGVQQPHAQFEAQDLFAAEDVGAWMWFLGVRSIAIKKGQPGNFADVSNQPAYSQMIDRVVMGFDGQASQMHSHDPCGEPHLADRHWEFTNHLRVIQGIRAPLGYAHGKGRTTRCRCMAMGESYRT